MKTEAKKVRQSVSLAATVASRIRTMAESRRLSATRMLVELIENGIEVEERKQKEFFDLAKRFRNEADPEAAKRLGDRMGQMVFVDGCRKSHDRRTFSKALGGILSIECVIARSAFRA